MSFASRNGTSVNVNIARGFRFRRDDLNDDENRKDFSSSTRFYRCCCRSKTTCCVFVAKSDDLFSNFRYENEFQQISNNDNKEILTNLCVALRLSFFKNRLKTPNDQRKFDSNSFTIFKRFASSFKSSIRFRALSRINSCRMFNSFSN